MSHLPTRIHVLFLFLIRDLLSFFPCSSCPSLCDWSKCDERIYIYIYIYVPTPRAEITFPGE